MTDRTSIEFGSESERMLVSFVRRLEAIADEMAELRADRAAVRAEAKAQGFSLKALDALLKRRAMEPELREHLDTVVPLYEDVVGLPGAHGARPLVDGGSLQALPAPKLTVKDKAMAEALAFAGVPRIANGRIG